MRKVALSICDFRLNEIICGLIMNNMTWSNLSPYHLGQAAKIYAKNELASQGFKVEDNRIVFRVWNKQDKQFEIIVRSVRNKNYAFIVKTRFDILKENLFLFFLLFEDGLSPKMYLIPACDWQYPNKLLRDRPYINKQSPPEYGVCITKENEYMLEEYEFTRQIKNI